MDVLSGSASLLTGTGIGQSLFQLRLGGEVVECRAVGVVGQQECHPFSFLPGFIRMPRRHLILAPASYVRLCHSVQESHGCCPCQPGGSTAGRQTDLPCPATCSPEGWKGENRVLEDWKQRRMQGEHRTHEAGTFGLRVIIRNLPEMGQMQECN